MDRKTFLKACGGACLAMAGIPLLTTSCTGLHYVQAASSGDRLAVPKAEFVSGRDRTGRRKYIVVRTDRSDYPIVVYALPGNEYRAMLMRCTHQGSELTLNGDILTCPAHGSEFSKGGDVIQGPAEQPLRTFIVSEDDANIYIQLT